MATIPEIEARIHALWAKGDARTLEESVELGRLLTALETEMPPGDFYTHVLDVLHIPARAAQQFMQQYRESQGVSVTVLRRQPRWREGIWLGRSESGARGGRAAAGTALWGLETHSVGIREVLSAVWVEQPAVGAW